VLWLGLPALLHHGVGPRRRAVHSQQYATRHTLFFPSLSVPPHLTATSPALHCTALHCTALPCAALRTEADGDDEDSSMLAVLMPPTIEQKGMALHIRCYGVEGLPRMDDYYGGTCDPYAKVEYAGVVLKTKHGEVCAVGWARSLACFLCDGVLGGDAMCRDVLWWWWWWWWCRV
jgi:hypothetical protein